MNLLTDHWLPVELRNGQHATISVADLGDASNPPVAFRLPRADFRFGATELLIGIFTALLTPETVGECRRLQRTPPGVDELQKQVAASPILPAFELDGDGPRFMQDFDAALTDGATHAPTALIIDGPGESTIAQNTDLFEKRQSAAQPVLSRTSAAIALFVLQSNAPSGGRGHRTGFRGGGPLTTIVIPHDNASLLDTIIANVQRGHTFKPAHLQRIFPWLAATRTSAPGDAPLAPADVHPLQAFFAMPRRIRLDFEDGGGRSCAISGGTDERVVVAYRRRAYGAKYSDVTMEHPLSPYRFDKKANRTLAIHPQRSGVQWDYFLGGVIGNAANRISPAATVTAYRDHGVGRTPTILAAGYATDNAKVEAYFQARLPLPVFGDEASRLKFDVAAARLVEASIIVARSTRAAIWHSKAESRNSFDGASSLISAADRTFWHDTEAEFLATITQWQSDLGGGKDVSPEWGSRWRRVLASTALRVFDHFVALDGGGSVKMLKDSSDRPVFRVAQQRRFLLGHLNGWSKSGKELFGKLGLPLPAPKSDQVPEAATPEAAQ